MASAAVLANFIRRAISAHDSTASVITLRVAGEAEIAAASVRASFAAPKPMRESERPSITSSAPAYPVFASLSAEPSAVHESVNSASNSVSAPAITTAACRTAASLSPVGIPSFALRTLPASCTAPSASVRTDSFSARSASSPFSRRISNPEAVIVTRSRRDSALLPFKSVATSFIVSKSPGFTPAWKRSQRSAMRVCLPVFFTSTVSFQPPSLMRTSRETFARPMSSVALPTMSAYSFAARMRSFFG